MELLSQKPKRPVIQSLFNSPTEHRDRSHAIPFPVIPEFSDLRELQEWFAFAGQFFADFRTTASVVPSSPQLAREMVQPLREQRAQVVLEFGPGTGPMTTQILDALPADGKVCCFEVNPRFVNYLQRNLPDSRMRVVEDGAQEAHRYLVSNGIGEVDGIVSSLPLSFFPGTLRHQILEAAQACLRTGGVFTQFQYASGLDCSGRFPKPYDLRPLLAQYFPRVERRMIWRNIPPAWVYRCYAE
jgi:phosphatidylethanolamine/phosphatidyl-N-methylethanolamine N-methyltransferase